MYKRYVIFVLTFVFMFVVSCFSVFADESDTIISEAAEYAGKHNLDISQSTYCVINYTDSDPDIAYYVCFSDMPFYINKHNRITTDGNKVCRINFSRKQNEFVSYSGSIPDTTVSNLGNLNIAYVNHNIMNHNRTEVIFYASDEAAPPDEPDEDENNTDIGDYSYGSDSVESEKGGVITKILDPIFTFINWILRWVPDVSVEFDSNWLAELVRLLRSALWFCPKDVVVTSFFCISSWMTIHLFYALFKMVVQFIPFIH